MHMKALVGCCVAGLLAAVPAEAVTVPANSSALVDLGLFGPGAYRITATGVVSLAGPIGSGFDIEADGVPAAPVTEPGYGAFNPSGTDYDFNSGYGIAGSGYKLGSLVGMFGGSSSYFTIGRSLRVDLASTTRLYAVVNDTFYDNNAGGFAVNVASVPEASSWALMLTGFGIVGAALRGSRRKAAAA
jgi:hypothetical protein